MHEADFLPLAHHLDRVALLALVVDGAAVVRVQADGDLVDAVEQRDALEHEPGHAVALDRAGVVAGQVAVRTQEHLALLVVDRDREDDVVDAPRRVVADVHLERLARVQVRATGLGVGDLHVGDLDLEVAQQRGIVELGGDLRALLAQVLTERQCGLPRLADRDELAVVEDRGAVADLADHVDGVGHEQDRAALALEPLDALEALALERLVADGEHLVDEQDLGVDVDRHRESEPRRHTRRVVLHLVVDEVLDLGERDDLVEDPVDLLTGESEDRRVQVDVLAPGEVAVEARAELEQRGDAAVLHDRPRGGPHDPGHALEQRRLARAVVAEEAEGLALVDVDGHVLERPELLVVGLAEVDHPLLERVGPGVVELEVLRDVVDLDRRAHQISSAKSSSRRPKIANAMNSDHDRTGEHDPEHPAGTTTGRRVGSGPHRLAAGDLQLVVAPDRALERDTIGVSGLSSAQLPSLSLTWPNT